MNDPRIPRVERISAVRKGTGPFRRHIEGPDSYIPDAGDVRLQAQWNDALAEAKQNKHKQNERAALKESKAFRFADFLNYDFFQYLKKRFKK